MNFDPKYKKITTIILLIVGICLILTGLILSKLMKDTSGDEGRYWFFEESISTGQPVILEDAFLVSSAEGEITFLYDHVTYVVEGNLQEPYFGVVNITIEGDKVGKLSIKPDAIEDVLHSYTEDGITLATTGAMSRKVTVPIYKVIDNQVEQLDWNALIVGASNISCVLDNGAVSAIIIKEDVIPTDIRVVIKNGSGIHYSDLFVKCISNGAWVNANETMNAQGVSSITIADAQGMLLCDASGNPLEEAYEGSFHIYRTDSGLVLVNELPMETYLKYVVPSEMQISFGHEALKAQAVCARTFAYSKIRNQSYAAYGANIDDSTAFQAYHNTGRYPEADAAVDETAGEIITCNGELITCYYYSTSPGVTNDMTTWESENTDYIACGGFEFSNGLNLQIESDFSKFISQQTQCYDSASSFYRWKSVLDTSIIKDEAKGALQNLSVKARNEAGYITALEFQYSNATEILRNENEIRTVLGAYQQEIILNNEQIRTDLSMVPSACFEVAEVSEGKIILRGGGFGHGIGMSQYGAKAMAEQGYDYKAIIEYYYENVVVKPLFVTIQTSAN